MLKTPPPVETTNYTFDELKLIVKAQHGGIEGLVSKVNALVDRMLKEATHMLESGDAKRALEIEEFLKTIDPEIKL